MDVIVLFCAKLMILSFLQGFEAQRTRVYLTSNNKTGNQSNLTTTCNTTGIIPDAIEFINPSCSQEPVLAWVGSKANLSNWVDFAGCRNVTTKSLPVSVNFSNEPNIYDCQQKCKGYNHTFMYISNTTCYCYYENDTIQSVCSSKLLHCGQGIVCNTEKASEGTTIALYNIKSSFNLTGSISTGGCGYVKIRNKTIEEKDAIDCLDNASVLCKDTLSNRSELNIYSSNVSNWSDAVNICLENNRTLPTAEDVDSQENNITDGLYWLSSVRDFKVTNEGKHCVASMMQNNTIMTPHLIACNTSLPVACLDPQDYDEINCTNASQETTNFQTTISNTGTGKRKGKFPSTLHIAIITSGSVGLVILTVFVAILCRQCRHKSPKQQNDNGGTAYRTVNKGQSRNNKAGDHELQPCAIDNEHNEENDVYDHTDTCRLDINTADDKDYDTMQGIRSETEGIYDQTGETKTDESQNLYSTSNMAEDVYNTAGETNLNNKPIDDSLYDSC